MPGGLPLLAGVGRAVGTVVQLSADAASILSLFSGRTAWGIFDANGSAVLVPDNIVSVELKQDWRISDAPQEAGAFQSYNKVRAPYEARVTMTKGGAGILSAIGIGSSADVAGFLRTLEALAASTGVYLVATPDRTYPRATISHYDYRRTAEAGVSLVTVDLWLQEVREVAGTGFANTAAPSGADPQHSGPVQSQPATPAQASAASVWT